MRSASRYLAFGINVPIHVLIQRHGAQTIASLDGFFVKHYKSFALEVKRKLFKYGTGYAGEQHFCNNLETANWENDGKIQLQSKWYQFEICHQIKYELPRWFWRKNSNYWQKSCKTETFEFIFMSILVDPLHDTRLSHADSHLFDEEAWLWMVEALPSFLSGSRDVCGWMNVNTSMYPRVSLIAGDSFGSEIHPSSLWSGFSASR